ncbi:DUF3895 domain-containing protein [Ammoniphilus sp. YIM 78166]|uniref:DUF3895 domain-containing protein n=1 Tax=Ammoniphilus sp. YIM 78166 TaxID=1644106 RepID=UPI00106F149F|nr:DUF3895 domain-containing protein [Ammoniphilus sp. YIM 78166]
MVDTEQLSLFGGEDEPIEEKKTEAKVAPIVERKSTGWHAVDILLENGLQSAREISEQLLRDAGSSEDRYVTGKPRVFVKVCRYLDSREDLTVLEAKEDKSDRVYKAKFV